MRALTNRLTAKPIVATAKFFVCAFACATTLAFSLLLCGCSDATTNTGSSTTSDAESSETANGDTPTSSNSADVIADGLVSFTVDGTTNLSGNFYLSFVYSRNLVMLDGQGNVVWSKHEEQLTEGATTGFWDFKKHVVDGKTYYSYHDNTGTYDNYGLEGYAPGERVILDENFNEIKRITFEESDVTSKGDPLDGHDFLMIDLDHYILSGYIKDTAYNNPDYPDGTSVVYSYLQEVDNDEVVWEFKSTDYPKLYALTVTDGSSTAADFTNEQTDAPDYVHFNSMRLDDEGNLVCSFRHLSSIIALDRTASENQILWKLSGGADEFGLTTAQKTSCQHYATVEAAGDKDESAAGSSGESEGGEWITVFDNGNASSSTRIASYLIDAANKKLVAFKEYALAGKFSRACGSVQRISDETYVIGWGAAKNDAQCMSVYDFAAGEELMTVTLDNAQNFTYRCVYYE